MPRFDFKARDRAGLAVESSVDAPSRKDALRLLSARGLAVSSVAEPPAAAAATAKAASRKKSSQPAAAVVEVGAAPRIKGDTPPRRGDRLPFLESLHELTTSGLSAGEAVRLLSIRLKEPRQRVLAEGLWTRLSEGAPLSRAMAAFPDVFDSSTVNLIHAGEATGSLNETLGRLIEHLVEEREMRRNLMSAMAYPVFMVFMSGGVILFFLFFLLPRLQTLLNSLGGKMPISTQILITVANFALHYGWMIAIAAVVGIISLWRWRATEAGRAKSDALLLKVPLIGPFIVSQTVLSFSQTYGVLLANGITASEALRMTEKQISNVEHRQAFDVAIARVMEGEMLSSALGRTGCFPELVLDRIAVGENTGNVVPSLKDIAKSYQKLISGQLNLFTKVISSSVLAGVFIFVGFIAFAIVSAVFQVSASFKVG